MHSTSPLTAAAVVALAALVCGVFMARVRQPPIVGYILAGVVLGPAGLALVKNREAIDTLAEFGVLLLLFVVGMELNLKKLTEGWRTALVTTFIQIGGSVAVALALHKLLGWSFGHAVLIGFVVSISSTAVVIKLLQSSGETDTPAGRTTIGVLIAQDMAVVPMTLILGGLSQKGFVAADFGKVGLSVLFLVLLLAVLVRHKVKLPFGRLVAEHADLSPLTGLAYCFGAAALSGLLGLSPAYGAFLAGVVIGNSSERHAMARSTQPIQSVLMMVFFLSVGLLLDLRFIGNNIGTVLTLLLMITVFKTALTAAALRMLGQSWPQALLVGVTLAQIGEFSFLLAEVGRDNKLIGVTDAKLIVAVTTLSLILSPLWLLAARRLHQLMAEGVTQPREIWRRLWTRPRLTITLPRLPAPRAEPKPAEPPAE